MAITSRQEAADEMTSFERLTALSEESVALARIVAKNQSAPVSLLRALSRSADEAKRKNVALNPSAPVRRIEPPRSGVLSAVSEQSGTQNLQFLQAMIS